MRKIVFDIETQNTFHDVGRRDPALLDISVVSIWDSETDKYSSFLIEEFDALWDILERSQVLIGFNSEYFDIPVLNKYYPGNLYGIKSIDLLNTIQEAYGRRARLDDIASATLGESKSADGLQAVAWWKNGEIDKIKEYCEQDVRVTKDLYEYMLEHKKVLIPDILTGKTEEVPVDISDWEEKDKSTGMTVGLGF